MRRAVDFRSAGFSRPGLRSEKSQTLLRTVASFRWPTKLNDDWNISVPPFKRDPLKELAEVGMQLEDFIRTTTLRLNLPKTSDTPTLSEFQVFGSMTK